jgi:8-oxo-dGTP pyrophosphatase MutT (NUDIX family)
MTEISFRPPIQQVSAIPYRCAKDGAEVCLITSIKKGRWGFPKGIIDPGETYVQTALKEAHEEAGLHGRILDDPVGVYEYAKWGTTLSVTVVLMEVTQCDDDWEESEMRQRRWVTPDVARQLVARRDVQRLFELALTRLQQRGKLTPETGADTD